MSKQLHTEWSMHLADLSRRMMRIYFFLSDKTPERIYLLHFLAARGPLLSSQISQRKWNKLAKTPFIRTSDWQLLRGRLVTGLSFIQGFVKHLDPCNGGLHRLVLHETGRAHRLLENKACSRCEYMSQRGGNQLNCYRPLLLWLLAHRNIQNLGFWHRVFFFVCILISAVA